VLERLEREDADERERGAPASERARQVARTTGQFLFALVSPQVDCEVLEIGGSRGYSAVWLAAGVRTLGGRVLSLENDPAKAAAWRRNVAEAGLEDWAELVEGDAFETLERIDDVFDIVFLDAEKDDYERLFTLARARRPRRRRQRPLTSRPARALFRRAPGGSLALERHRSARPGSGAQRHPPLISWSYHGKEVVRA
jgi:predicted O-methyltransferase YrrM